MLGKVIYPSTLRLVEPIYLHHCPGFSCEIDECCSDILVSQWFVAEKWRCQEACPVAFFFLGALCSFGATESASQESEVPDIPEVTHVVSCCAGTIASFSTVQVDFVPPGDSMSVGGGFHR